MKAPSRASPRRSSWPRRAALSSSSISSAATSPPTPVAPRPRPRSRADQAAGRRRGRESSAFGRAHLSDPRRARHRSGPPPRLQNIVRHCRSRLSIKENPCRGGRILLVREARIIRALPMSLVANLLRADHIVLDLQVSSKKRLFEQAGLLFENHHGLARKPGLRQPVRARAPGSTGLGQGVAIPHGRIKGLKEAAGRVPAARAAGALRRPRRQTPSAWYSCCLVPERRPRSTCRSFPSLRRCSVTKRCARR